MTVLAVLLILSVEFASAQSTSVGEPLVPTKSRAEQDAEQSVALSPDKIIELLRQEPGLLLQVKRMLVRKAYEQGRILDPEDLTDDALFQLLREDHTICVLATRELEDRGYVRAKPTQQEIELERQRQARYGSSQASSVQEQASGTGKSGTQERAFWEEYERQLQSNPVPMAPPVQPPAQTPVVPATPPLDNAARQLEMAQAFQNQNMLDNSGIASGMLTAPVGMSRISPEQLPLLLGTAMGSGSDISLTQGSAVTGARTVSPPFVTFNTSTNDIDDNLYRRLAGSPGTNQYDRNVSLQANTRAERPPVPSPEDLNLDRPQIRRWVNPYANVPSLYDLYSQVSPRPAVIERFGNNIFRNGTGNIDELPMDFPAGPDYVLGPGDGVSIDVWGGVAQRFQRTVDSAGRLALPEVGTIEVSGRTLGDVQRIVQAALRTQFHGVEADVSLSRIRAVRVYVVGEVENPGAYDISSLSTPLNALYAAGGTTSRGSLRHIRVFRGKDLVQEVDAYDLLLHGVRSDPVRIQSGDTIQVPPIGPEVTVRGMVMHPAIYELRNETKLAEVLNLSGGILPSGTYRHIQVERVVAHQNHTMLQLDIPDTNDEQSVNQALNTFAIQDGDNISISPIVPYSEQTVYLDGHVFHPGKYAYRTGMKISDLIHSYADLLPEPSPTHAEIIRLEPPDYTPVVLTFSLADAFAGNAQDLALKPFDTVRIFGRFDFQDPPVITLSGEVRDPGDHVTNGATRLRDAIYLAGGPTPDAELDSVQIFRRGETHQLKVISVDLAKALAGDPQSNILLEAKDRVFVHRDLNKLDPPTVVIRGQVARPGKYPLGVDMKASDLVRVSGGFKRGAYTETADLTRYELVNGSSVAGESRTVAIAKAMSGEPDTDVVLHDGDVLTIKQVAGWNDVGASITVSGEVTHTGTYGIQEGERLSSILQRAGGFLGDAYPYGAIFERKQIRQLEQENREQLIRQVQIDGQNLTLIPEADVEQKIAKEAAVSQWQSALQRLQSSPPSGRLVIHISKDIKRWANSPADVQVRAGDLIYIPKRPNFVMVEGSVYNPTAVTYKPGKDAGWYLKEAGGPTNSANKRAVFVVRADGSVSGGSGGLFRGGVERTSLHSGDLVMVPERAYSGTTKWKTTLESAQLAYAVGVAIQVVRSF